MYPIAIIAGAIPLLGFTFSHYFTPENHQKNNYWHTEIEWNIDPNSLKTSDCPSFGPDFMFGGASSATQVEGLELAKGGLSEKTTWRVWEKKQKPEKNWVGKGIGRKTRYKEDVQHLKSLGLNTYRFSISWDKVEPELGIFDIEELDWYVQFCDELIDNNIRPMLCFFHHTWPLWFDKLGGFEKEENIRYFVEFVEQVYYYLYTHVKKPEALEYVLSFNEPTGYALVAYLKGDHYPGQKGKGLGFVTQLKKAGFVIQNMFKAHKLCHNRLHKINSNVKLGIAHAFMPSYPYNKKNPGITTKALIGYLDYFANDSLIHYFRDGYFSFASKGAFAEYDTSAKGTLDFIGVNYYGPLFVEGMNVRMSRPGDLTSESKGRKIYPEGMYASIQKASKLGIPMIITENGISTNNDQLKNDYIKLHLNALKKSIDDGYDVQGYMLWAPIDCWGWDNGFNSRYGLVGVNHETKERFFRPQSAEYLTAVIEKSRKQE